eukprot:gene39221-62861_t
MSARARLWARIRRWWPRSRDHQGCGRKRPGAGTRDPGGEGGLGGAFPAGDGRKEGGSETMIDADGQKRAAGEAAAALVETGMIVGLGTGSTAAWFVRALAARKLNVIGVPTSRATEDLAASLGMRIGELGETRTIDLTVDGADEIGPGLSLIKGGGAALLREKLVWEASTRCVVI